MPDATVARFEVRLVRWPLKSKRRQGSGDIAGALPGVILKLTTSEGAVGWGEAAPWSLFTGTAEAAAAALDVYLRPVAMGARIADSARTVRDADRALVGHAEAKAALAMAFDDLRGKMLGASVADIHGGAFRRSVPLSVSLANPDFKHDLAFAQARVSEGVRLFKVKTGFLSHRDDLWRLEQLRAALPSTVELRVDYNQALDPWDALRRLRDLEEFQLGFIEQPVARQHHDVLGELSRALTTPILVDESIFSPADAAHLARLRYADGVSIKLMKCGGIAQAQAIAAILEAAGIAAYGGAFWESGIGIAAGLHFAAATPHVTLGCEFYAPFFAFDIDVLQTPLSLDKGEVRLPEGPGLGVEIDEKALQTITEIVRT